MDSRKKYFAFINYTRDDVERVNYKGEKGCSVTCPYGNTLFLLSVDYRTGTSLKNVGNTDGYWQPSLRSTFSSLLPSFPLKRFRVG